MARTYLVDSKRYQYVDFVPTVGATEYLLSEADNNKWIKIDTTNEDGDVQLPLNISEGFRCIIENTGPFTVNYLNEAGTSAATQQDLFTEDQYRTVEVAFNQNEWRIQGYIGRNDISSLYDVNVTAGGLPEDEDVLTYNLNTGVWQAGKQPKFIPRSPENLDFIIQESDHGKIIPVNTTFAPVDVAINTGLPAGFYCRVQNVGTGSMTITPGVTWNSPITSVDDQYAYIDIFHSGLEQYYVVSNEGLGSPTIPEDYLAVNSSGTPPTAVGAESIALGAGANVGSSATNSIAIGLNANIAGSVINAIKIGSSAAATLSSNNSIMIGNEARSASDNAIVIGSNANASSLNNRAIVIGNNAVATGNVADDGIAIGTNANIIGTSSIAIGINSQANTDNSTQIGTGTNNTANTIQFLSEIIASDEGVLVAPTSGVPASSPLAGTAKFDSSSNTLYIYNGTSWVSTVLT